MVSPIFRRSAPACALLVSLVATGCRGPNILSRGEQIRIGQQGSVELEKRFGVSKNPEDNTLVQTIGQKLVTANRLTKWPFTFKVLNSRELNAVSLPGGPIYVFRGTIDAVEGDPDELASIIGHEMAHIEHQHLARAYTQGVLTNLAISLGLGGDLQTGAQIMAVFAEFKFSRGDEYQADSSGIRYAYKAGFDPNGLVRFFEKLQRLERQGQGDIISNNLRTHPLTAPRIERAKKEISKITQEVNAAAERRNPR